MAEPAKAPAPTSPVTQPKSTGATVTIACSLPFGLRATLWNMDPAAAMKIDTPDGGRIIRPQIGDPVFLRGTRDQRIVEKADDKGNPQPTAPVTTVTAGYGLTHGVDRDWAEAWFKQNADYEPVRRGAIFMQANEREARAQATDHATDKKRFKTGLEPIDPDKPGPGIERADFTKAA